MDKPSWTYSNTYIPILHTSNDPRKQHNISIYLYNNKTFINISNNNFIPFYV